MSTVDTIFIGGPLNGKILKVEKTIPEYIVPIPQNIDFSELGYIDPMRPVITRYAIYRRVSEATFRFANEVIKQ